MSTEESVVSKPSKEKLFKQKTGYSKTMKRNMRKNNCSTVEEYRVVRKARRLKEAVVVRSKRDAARAGRKVKETKKKK